MPTSDSSVHSWVRITSPQFDVAVHTLSLLGQTFTSSRFSLMNSCANFRNLDRLCRIYNTRIGV